MVLKAETIADGVAFPESTLRLTFTSPADRRDDWALFRPGDPSRPVVVYMHGSFSSGDQLFTRPDIREHFLPVLLRENLSLLTPNLRGTTYMCPATVADTAALLDAVQERFLPGARFILLGGSGGASSAQIFALRCPERVAGLIALGACDLLDRLEFARRSELPVMQDLARAIITSYGGPPEEVPEAYRAHSILAHPERLDLPFLLASGECDALIPIAKVRRVAEALRQHPHFTYREVPGGNHDSPLWLPVEEMLRDVGYECAAGPG
jgi:pimeloyl-ACP methyl ester carboxylesterase